MIQMTKVTLTVTTSSNTNRIVYRHRFLQPYSPERSPVCASFSCGSSILKPRDLQLRITIIVTFTFLTSYLRKIKIHLKQRPDLGAVRVQMYSPITSLGVFVQWYFCILSLVSVFQNYNGTIIKRKLTLTFFILPIVQIINPKSLCVCKEGNALYYIN